MSGGAPELSLGDLAQRLAEDPELLAAFAAAALASGAAGALSATLLPSPADPPDELVIELKKPLEAAGLEGPVTSLKLREPDVGEMIQLQGKVGPDRVAHLIFLQTGTPLSALKRMKQRDMNAALDYYGLFS